jgi:hypothetical protein
MKDTLGPRVDDTAPASNVKFPDDYKPKPAATGARAYAPTDDKGEAAAAIEKAAPILKIVDRTGDTTDLARFGQMASVSGLVFHHTGGDGGVDGVINTFRQRGFPAQFVIDKEGTVHQVLPDGAKGQHIKNASAFVGSRDASLSNANTIGVEIVGKDDANINPKQVAAARALYQKLAENNPQLTPDRVFGHGELNPGHKKATEGMQAVNAIRGQPVDTMFTAIRAQVSPEAAIATDYFLRRGYSKIAVAGIVGNLIGESEVNPAAKNGPSSGIAQWLGPRLEALTEFAVQRKMDYRELGVQLAFAEHELGGKEYRAKAGVERAKDVAQSTAAFMGFERPKNFDPNYPDAHPSWPRRLASAKKILSLMGNDNV